MKKRLLTIFANSKYLKSSSFLSTIKLNAFYTQKLVTFGLDSLVVTCINWSLNINDESVVSKLKLLFILKLKANSLKKNKNIVDGKPRTAYVMLHTVAYSILYSITCLCILGSPLPSYCSSSSSLYCTTTHSS